MEDIKRALDKMGKDVSTTITALRTEMREQYEGVGKDVSGLRHAVDHLQTAVDETQRGLVETQQGLAETQRGLVETQRGLVETQRGLVEMQQSVDNVQRGLARQAHVLDQGLAETHDLLARHRENVGSIVLTYVEDLNAVKSDVRALGERVDRLERPPAA